MNNAVSALTNFCSEIIIFLRYYRIINESLLNFLELYSYYNSPSDQIIIIIIEQYCIATIYLNSYCYYC